jgi:MoaA/NifB/PqqE/SkfB family radical SAM enzyme
MTEQSTAKWQPYFRVLADRVRAREFQSLFLFVTSRCNARCRTCFYFDKLNSRDDLTFAQIARISETAPAFRKLWISGGEPFLREELADILSLFVHRNGVRNINLPTNGLLPERIFRVIDRVLEECPRVAIDLNFSLDGMGATHDSIRGVPGNFARTTGALQAARERYRGVRRLRLNVVTVLASENIGEVASLGEYVARNLDADGHYFEVVRGETPDPALKRLTRAELADLHRRLAPLHRWYSHKLFGHLPFGVRHAAEVYYLGNLRSHYDLHEQCLERPAQWPMPCTAGETTLVIDHNGAFRACELRGILGNLREYGFDVRAALASEAMRRETEAIPKANCWCTHSCFIQDSSKFSPGMQLWRIPATGLREAIGR